MALRSFALCGLFVAKGDLAIPSKEIAPGVEMPVLSIGTGGPSKWKADQCEAIVTGWLGLGGKAVDTAWIYGTEDTVGKTIASLGANRSELFITSKIPGCADAKGFVNKDLKALGTDYIDLLLIHSDIGACKATWKTLEELHAQGVLRAIGVSNFDSKHLQKILDVATVKPAVNQVKINVLSHDDETLTFCKANGITPMAYSPLEDDCTKHPAVVAAATAHNVSTYQVALKWVTQKDWLLTFQSTKAEHQAEDADLFGFDLTDVEMAALDAAQSG